MVFYSERTSLVLERIEHFGNNRTTDGCLLSDRERLTNAYLLFVRVSARLSFTVLTINVTLDFSLSFGANRLAVGTLRRLLKRTTILHKNCRCFVGH